MLDASALLEILLRTSLAERLMDRALDASERMHAPHLLDVEVTQVLRRLVRLKEVTVARAEQALDDLSKLVIERHEHQSLVGRVWQLRDSISAYDGVYVALAEALDAPLLTCDAKLAGAHGHHATIELVRN
ncbi:MAG TPA: type II toxin-antitoxin system VapC family toxin [Steroidobacteraceae bacterium]|nr:type II toxin-antitoxin system VapC family toxin [Steroidobacteraceae bacterium]